MLDLVEQPGEDHKEAGTDGGTSAQSIQVEQYRANRRIILLDVVRTDFNATPIPYLGLDSGRKVDDDARALGVHDHVSKAEYLNAEHKRSAKYMAKLLLCYSVHDPETGYCQVGF